MITMLAREIRAIFNEMKKRQMVCISINNIRSKGKLHMLHETSKLNLSYVP